MTLPELLRCLHEYHEYKYMFSFKEYWNKSWILERKTTSVQNCATSISQLSGYMSYDTKSMDLVSLVRTSRLYPHGSRIHKKIALIIWKIAGLNRWICILAMFVHFNVYIYKYMYAYVYVHLYMYICVYVYMYIIEYDCICIYIYIQYVYIISRGFPFYQVKMLETPQASKDRRLSASKRTRCFAMSRSSQPSPAGSQKWRIIGPWAIASL